MQTIITTEDGYIVRYKIIINFSKNVNNYTQNCSKMQTSAEQSR